MARNFFDSLFLLTVGLTVLFCRSSAQTTHNVGGAAGWIVPGNTADLYSAWLKNRTFRVGDVLVFNFVKEVHDVAQLRTENAYNLCNSTDPLSHETEGPARFNLTRPGPLYFICTFPNHCGFGQKVMVNVSAAAVDSPAGAPAPAAVSTPPPASSAAPSPSRSARTYTVGGSSTKWRVPPSLDFYNTWASNITFSTGDVLVFEFTAGQHDVEQVSKSNYENCKGGSKALTSPPVNITLNSSGPHYFICTFANHCSLGQKLTVNVTGDTSTGTPPPSSAGAPSSPATPTTPSSPSPDGSATPPSPASHAPTLALSGFSAGLLSLAGVYLLC